MVQRKFTNMSYREMWNSQFNNPHGDSESVVDFINRVAQPFSMERPCSRATKSEIRRLCQKGCIQINGEIKSNPIEKLSFPIREVIMFPNNNKRRIRLGMLG